MIYIFSFIKLIFNFSNKFLFYFIQLYNKIAFTENKTFYPMFNIEFKMIETINSSYLKLFESQISFICEISENKIYYIQGILDILKIRFYFHSRYTIYLHDFCN
jgi:hypothetical protein